MLTSHEEQVEPSPRYLPHLRVPSDLRKKNTKKTRSAKDKKITLQGKKQTKQQETKRQPQGHILVSTCCATAVVGGTFCEGTGMLVGARGAACGGMLCIMPGGPGGIMPGPIMPPGGKGIPIPIPIPIIPIPIPIGRPIMPGGGIIPGGGIMPAPIIPGACGIMPGGTRGGPAVPSSAACGGEEGAFARGAPASIGAMPGGTIGPANGGGGIWKGGSLGRGGRMRVMCT